MSKATGARHGNQLMMRRTSSAGQGVVMAIADKPVETNGQPARTAAPSVGDDIRSMIPKLGLREYWYPALLEKDVSNKKGTFLKLLGDDMVAFRGQSGKVVIVPNACPHR